MKPEAKRSNQDQTETGVLFTRRKVELVSVAIDWDEFWLGVKG